MTLGFSEVMTIIVQIKFFRGEISVMIEKVVNLNSNGQGIL